MEIRMFLDIVFVEMLAQNGTRDSFIIKPKSKSDQIITESCRDIHPDSPNDKFDLGGNRIHNFDECTMKHLKNIHQLKVISDEFSFKIKHEGIPVGSSGEGHVGIYNLILEPGFRFTNLHIIDPFDNKHKDKEKKEFEYQVFWDKKYEVQLVEMKLRSRRGSFSFVLNGSFAPISSPKEHIFVNCPECDGRLISLTDSYNHLNDNEKKALSSGFIETLNKYVKMEPEILPGVSIKVNKVLEEYQEKHNKEKKKIK
jgi:hypothetical protein